MNNNLLIEFLTEELPTKDLVGIPEDLKKSLSLSFKPFITASTKTTPFVSPRRFGVLYQNLVLEAQTPVVKRKGPPVKLAFKENQSTKALLGFLASISAEVTVDDLYEQDGYFYFNEPAKKLFLIDNLETSLLLALESLQGRGFMTYANGLRFIRPVHNFVLMLNNNVIELTKPILGLKTSRITLGHRVMGKKNLQLDFAENYFNKLQEEGKVIAEFNARKESLREQLQAKAKDLNLLLANDLTPDLMDEVTSLIEYPCVLQGQFDAEFLKLPSEVLILSMAKHQKYFALKDHTGALSNKFLFAANLISSHPEFIVSGNERVLQARLKDAQFFITQDLALGTNLLSKNLNNISYQKGLGTLFDRSIRLANILEKLASDVLSKATINKLALTLKCDLASSTVEELPEFQGIMSSYYFLQENNQEKYTAKAIREHYLPRFAEDDLPESHLGKLLSLADKLEYLVGLWGSGIRATGDKDQYALRRAALAIARLLQSLPQYSLSWSLNLAGESFKGLLNLSPSAYLELIDFITQRFHHFLKKNNSDESYRLALSSVFNRKVDNFGKAEELTNALAKKYQNDPEFQKLLEANKRLDNLLRKQELTDFKLQSNLFNSQEIEFYRQYEQLETGLNNYAQEEDWNNYFTEMQNICPLLDEFFAKVLVMDENKIIRNNRLALLFQVKSTLNKVVQLGNV